MKSCIVSYFPSTNQIICIYNSIEESEKDVRFLNVFNRGGREKLRVGIAELTDEEYAALMDEGEDGDGE